MFKVIKNFQEHQDFQKLLIQDSIGIKIVNLHIETYD